MERHLVDQDNTNTMFPPSSAGKKAEADCSSLDLLSSVALGELPLSSHSHSLLPASAAPEKYICSKKKPAVGDEVRLVPARTLTDINEIESESYMQMKNMEVCGSRPIANSETTSTLKVPSFEGPGGLVARLSFPESHSSGSCNKEDATFVSRGLSASRLAVKELQCHTRGHPWRSRAQPSRFCHICSRTSKKVEQIHCRNFAAGACRKVVCRKCFLE